MLSVVGLVLLTLANMLVVIGVENKPDFINGTQCVFVPETKKFSCHLGNKSVRCSAVANFTDLYDGADNFYVFGIGPSHQEFPITSLPPTARAFASSTYFYNLYPRSSSKDNTTYSSSLFGGHRIVLFTGNFDRQYGIRVIDPECFGRMLKLLNMATDFEHVTVDTTTSVKLIGALFVNDPAGVVKRWPYGFDIPYYLNMGLLGLG